MDSNWIELSQRFGVGLQSMNRHGAVGRWGASGFQFIALLLNILYDNGVLPESVELVRAGVAIMLSQIGSSRSTALHDR